MKILINIKETIQSAASRYYKKAKSARAKKERLKDEIKKTEELIISASEETRRKRTKRIRVKTERKWYERFHHFCTTNGFLVITGKDARQNDMLYSRYLDEDDLFFHADIHGAAATILKNGKKAEDIDRVEAAQFAGVYSSAWKHGYSSVDVYAVGKAQVSKYESGMYVGKGAFMIRGERRWFKAMPLLLTVYMDPDDLEPRVFPGNKKTSMGVVLTPGTVKKGVIAKEISKQFNSVLPKNEKVEESKILAVLPSGSFSIVERHYEKRFKRALKGKEEQEGSQCSKG